MTDETIVDHIPVRQFSQRLEILMALRGQKDTVGIRVLDIIKPRDPVLLAKTQGTTALPVLEVLSHQCEPVSVLQQPQSVRLRRDPASR